MNRSGWWSAAYTAALFALAVDVRHSGPLSRAEHDHCLAPAPCPTAVRCATRLGERNVLLGATALATGVALRGGAGPALRPIVIVAGGVAARALVARAVARPRPPREWWQEEPSGPSFPSRHTTWAFLGCWILATGLRAGRRPALLMAGGVVAAVGYSRVRLGVHWPTDVAGAVLAGLAWTSASRAVAR
ncbi:MAG: phosphatase PAP2 family protein [Sciscionella sp.]